MSFFTSYLDEIKNRKKQALNPKPIEGAGLMAELILQIKDPNNQYKNESLEFLIYNTLPLSICFLALWVNSLKQRWVA